MVNYREILRLNSLNYTQRQIAASVHSSRNTISEILHVADAKGLHWPLNDTFANQKIMSLLYPQRKDAPHICILGSATNTVIRHV